MRTLTISLEDITGVPAADGDMVWLSAPVRRPSGVATLVPREKPVVLTGGEGSVEVHPGPLLVRFELAGVTFREGPSARVVVPEGEGPVSLTGLLSAATDWSPEELSEFTRLRDEAVAAAASAGGHAADAAQSASDASGSASAAAGSESAAAGHASDAEGYASDADGARNEVRTIRDEQVFPARDDAEAAAGQASQSAQSASGHASDASTSAGQAATSAGEADGHADRAEQAANSFDLTATASTGAPGSDAAVAVTGDGPAYEVDFTIPGGVQGPPGDPGPAISVGDDTFEAGDASAGDVGIALGWGATAGEIGAVLGAMSSAGGGSAAVGPSVSATGDFAVSVGFASVASDDHATAIGAYSIAEGEYSVAIGSGAHAEDDFEIALGAAQAHVQVAGSLDVAGDFTVGGQPIGGGSVGWGDIDNKPTAFPPDTHTHPIADVSGLAGALGGKADTSHTHSVGDVSGLQSVVDDVNAATQANTGGSIVRRSQNGRFNIANTVNWDSGEAINARSADARFVNNGGGVAGIERLTQAQYDNLTPDPDTVYIVEG